MITLAIDTSTAGSSVAIALNGRDLASLNLFEVRQHSQILFEHLQLLLKLAGVDLDQVDVFAAISGPGSFTGLRIGLAATEGMARTLARPVIGITGFDAQAGTLGLSGYVAVLIDAGRGEVFFGLRSVSETGQTVLAGPDLVGPIDLVLDEITKRVAGTETRVCFVGNGIARYEHEICHLAERRGRRVAVSSTVSSENNVWFLLPEARPLAAWAAKSATRLVWEGKNPGLHAYYLKPSDAERKWTNLRNHR